MLKSNDTAVRAIAFILCGITLPRAEQRVFLSELRNNFTHLEEFPNELRQIIADNEAPAPNQAGQVL